MLGWLVLGCVAVASPPAAVEAVPMTPAWTLLQRHGDRPVVVAHRGASGQAPENTLAAYERAVALGAVAAETDVFLTADRAIVALHDPTLDRTTSGAGPVAAQELAAIQALDAGSWFDPAFADQRVPTLGQVLDRTIGRLVLCVEIKAGDGIVSAVRDVLDQAGARDQVVIFSFDADAIGEAGVVLPDVPSLLLATRQGLPRAYDPGVIDQALLLGADGVGFNHGSLTAELVAAAHGAGLPVFVYTVNTAPELARVLALGVDGVITDWPDRVRGWLDTPPPGRAP